MTLIIYGLLGLLATAARSTLALHLSGMSGLLFDLNIPLIVALGMSGTFKRRLPAALLIGFWADCLSVAPFGFYIALYGWFFASIRGLGMLIQIDRALVVGFILVAGILLEYLSGFIFALQVSQRIQQFGLGMQLLWAIIFGTLIVMIARYGERIFQQQMNKIEPVD